MVTIPPGGPLGPTILLDRTLAGAGSSPLTIVQAPPPNPQALSPSSTKAATAATITITGTDLGSTVYVTISGSLVLTAATTSNTSATSAQFTLPPDLIADTYTIGVVGLCGSSPTTLALTLN
jgi:hypothetical protein